MMMNDEWWMMNDDDDGDDDDEDDDDDVDGDGDVVVVTFNAQVAKLCVARWKPWSWTCAFCPTKHSVFWCSDMSSASARANWGVCPYTYII